jgi:signal transduction histidine kinase
MKKNVILIGAFCLVVVLVSLFFLTRGSNELRPLILFMYGQAFFVLALATAFQFQPSSQFRLANSLWSLSLFGFVHAVAEWGHVFIPMQASTLAPDTVLKLVLFRHLLNIASFAVLFHFGLALLTDTWRVNPWIRLTPLVIFVGWLGALLATNPLHFSPGLFETLNTYEAAGRLALALPGSALAGIALYLQVGQLSELGLGRLASSLRSAAGGFLFYAFLAGVVGPAANFFPLSVFNADAFFDTFGVPIELIRTAVVSLIGISMVRIVRTFNIEAQRRLEVAETQRAILNERLRISRDLHDGVMQSIYGVGLNLKAPPI